MKGFTGSLLVSLVCSAPLLAQERDRSLERIALELQEPIPITPGVSRLRNLPKNLGHLPWFRRPNGARSFASRSPLASTFHEHSKVSRRRISDVRRPQHDEKWKRNSNGSRNSSDCGYRDILRRDQPTLIGAGVIVVETPALVGVEQPRQRNRPRSQQRHRPTMARREQRHAWRGNAMRDKLVSGTSYAKTVASPGIWRSRPFSDLAIRRCLGNPIFRSPHHHITTSLDS